MKNVLVTGCAGFIASHLAEALLKEGCTVWGIDNFYPYYSPAIKRDNIEEVKKTAEDCNGTFNFIEGSILNDEDLDKLPDDLDTIFHLAAIAGVRNSIENPTPYFQINVEGTVRLLKKYKDSKFIFASSSSVLSYFCHSVSLPETVITTAVSSGGSSLSSSCLYRSHASLS